ncbi:MAG TPA: DUF6527 family protein [Polyangiaceae bacterium]
MIARLSDPWFEATFIGRGTEKGSFCYLSSIDGAQGINLWCPCGYGKAEYPLDGARPHGLIVPFANPRGAAIVEANFGITGRDRVTKTRWTMSGTNLEDLTLTPSVDVGTPSCWHGFITNGNVT